MAKKTDYRQPGSGYQQAPPNIIHHPVETMKPKPVKPKPVLGKQSYSNQQEQKG
jgi:hypothetical protein